MDNHVLVIIQVLKGNSLNDITELLEFTYGHPIQTGIYWKLENLALLSAKCAFHKQLDVFGCRVAGEIGCGFEAVAATPL